MIDAGDIDAAAERIAPYVRRTPLLALRGPVPCELKLEQLQVTGSFKARGAFNTLLSQKVPASGVAAASGGNHGIAVAHAARELGHKAAIFVPEIASPAKIAAIRAAKAEIHIGGARYADALAACEAYQAETGAMSIHAYDAEPTITGQGTVAREWEQQSAGLDTVLVAVGGGGLIAGIAAYFGKRIRVVGVEPEGSRCLYNALEAGGPVDVKVDSIAADSLGARSAGALNFTIARLRVAEVKLVTDAAIRAAQRTLWREARLVTEPGGAAAYAALSSGAYRPAPGERVGVLVCGANTDPITFGAVLDTN
ncbi:threonine/serine dehydratase [Acuticoccus sp. MNP-M23]|uniref:threonine/serine dehydratase n=1 Tax=Acuticoccus sp. MNP-M23 TaxID=3072793 RepID=UPI00281507C6|nr:threonine/serine dehydratase [Acuticoccus sp. MNP-M23]WMS44172.1 threonine/serine dehydratase [Acuticoccus sp. MNP-M23]